MCVGGFRPVHRCVVPTIVPFAIITSHTGFRRPMLSNEDFGRSRFQRTCTRRSQRKKRAGSRVRACVCSHVRACVAYTQRIKKKKTRRIFRLPRVFFYARGKIVCVSCTLELAASVCRSQTRRQILITKRISYTSIYMLGVQTHTARLYAVYTRRARSLSFSVAESAQS